MLVRLMLRTALVEALRGKTSVGDRVFDSSLTALSFGPNGQVSADDNDGPFIAVYTGDGRFDNADLHDRGFSLGSAACEVLIQFGVSQKMVETDQETDEETLIGFSFPPVDEALQLSLDLIGRQILDELVTPTSAWGNFAQRVIVKASEVGIEAALNHEPGQKLAAYQLRFVAQTVSEPKDQSERYVAEEYLTLLQAVASNQNLYGDQIAQFEALLSDDGDAAEAARKSLGHSLAGWTSLGLAPLADADDILDEATVEIVGRGTFAESGA